MQEKTSVRSPVRLADTQVVDALFASSQGALLGHRKPSLDLNQALPCTKRHLYCISTVLFNISKAFFSLQSCLILSSFFLLVRLNLFFFQCSKMEDSVLIGLFRCSVVTNFFNHRFSCIPQFFCVVESFLLKTLVFRKN